MKTVTDLTGLVFGNLKVVDFAGYNNSKKTTWNCICSCGKSTITGSGDLKSGKSKSCGCSREKAFTHGLSNRKNSRNKIYGVWKGIKRRCYSSKDAGYVNYGGRGIKVCDDWRANFLSFYEWAVSSGYKEGLFIERVNNDGDYCPENCTWADKKTQANNTRRTVFIEKDGLRMPLTHWAKEIGVSRSALWNRCRKMSPLDAINKR